MLASPLLVGMLISSAIDLPAPQGEPERAPAFALPSSPVTVSLSPYLTAGVPDRNGTRAAGAADFDGNGVEDLWLLAGTGPHDGEISVQMARTATVGRYRTWHAEPPAGPSFTDGATLRAAMTEQDIALFVGPGITGLRRLQFTWSMTGDPRLGPSAFWSLGYILPFSINDTGIYEIETRNDSRDSCDDIVLLIDTGASTEVRKLSMTSGPGGYTITATVSASIPLHVEKLRLLDIDANGVTDFLVEAPGLGVLVCRDDGAGGFQPAAFIPTSLVGVTDLLTGDLVGPREEDRAGDTFGICTNDAVLLGWFTAAGLQLRMLPAPAGVGPLATAAIAVENTTTASVIGVPRDGQALWVQRYLRTTRQFDRALAITPSDPTPYQGTGSVELPALVTDLDDDGDDDLLLQHATGQGWYLVRNTGSSRAPAEAIVEHLGPLGLESGFFWERISVTMPADWSPAHFDEVEVAVFLKDPVTGVEGLWDRQILPIDLVQRRIRFDLFMQVINARVAQMHANPSYWRPLFYPAGMTAGGYTQISIHGKTYSDPLFADKPKRFESLIVIHDPGGHGNKSAQGVVFETRSEPMLPQADDDILPWN